MKTASDDLRHWCCSSFTLKSSCSEMLAFSHMLMSPISIWRVRHRGGRDTRLFHITWNLRCTELKIGFAVSDAFMPGPASNHLDLFQYSFPNRISGPLANQRVGNLQVSATTSKERYQNGGGGWWPPRGAGLIWQLKWDAISQWGVRAARAD